MLWWAGEPPAFDHGTRAEGVWTASFTSSSNAIRGAITWPPFRHCRAATPRPGLDELSERIKEAIGLYLEVEGETSEVLDFVGIQRVTIAS